MEPFALPSPLREALQCCAPRSVSSEGRLQPAKPHLGKHNEFFGKSNLAFFMNKIYFQSMSTPINKNTSLAGIAKAVLGAPCTRKYFCFSINFLRPACFFPGLSQGRPLHFPGKSSCDDKLSSGSSRVPLFQRAQTLGCALLLHPTPSCNPERNWALSDEQRREEPHPPFIHPLSTSSKLNPKAQLPSASPVSHSPQSIVKTQPPLLFMARPPKAAYFA